MTMKYNAIRKTHWSAQKKKLKKEFGIDFKNSPYTFFKAAIYIEFSAIIVFFLQSSSISPNTITSFYALLGIIGGFFIASNDQNLIVFGLLIFFFKGILDWSDGLLARLNGSTTELGGLLDDWAGYIGQLSFWIGFGFYVFNETAKSFLIYLILIFIFLKCVDLKLYSHIYIIKKFFEKKFKRISIKNKTKSDKILFSNFLKFVIKIIQNTLDDRARTVDLICLLILINSFYVNVFFLEYIFYLIFFKSLIIFSGNYYLVYSKKYISQLDIKK